MRQVRRIGWGGLALFGAAGAIGMLLAVGAAIAAGDWWLAPMPWIGIGMNLLVAGLAGVTCFALLLDLVEPIGAWRLLAIPPALLVGGFWVFVLVLGLPTTGGTELDVVAILYTLPLVMAVLVVCTAALALPALVGRRAPVSGPQGWAGG